VLAVGVTLRMQQEQPGIETAPPMNDTSALRASKEPAAPPAASVDKVAPAESNLAKLKKDNSAAREADDQRASRRDAATAAPPPVQEKKRAYVEGAAAPAPEKRQEPKAFTDSVQSNVVPAPAANPMAPPPAAAAPAPAQAAMAQAREKSAVSADAAKDAKNPQERELDRIAQLRREGRDAEADEALAKFRKDHPDYKIPDAIWEQVKPR